MAFFQTRFHIQLADRRTTVSVDQVLAQMMAIKLGYEPETPEAHQAVREWLQDTIVSHLGPMKGVRASASQWARVYLIEEISDRKLHRQWEDFRIASVKPKRKNGRRRNRYDSG